MNTPKKYFPERMLKHWVTSVPIPAYSRRRLLLAAANLKKSNLHDISWFCAISPGRRNLQYFLYISWPVTDGFHARSAAGI